VFRISAFVNENMEQSPVVKLTHDKNIVCEWPRQWTEL
jgi:hypothetical protein